MYFYFRNVHRYNVLHPFNLFKFLHHPCCHIWLHRFHEVYSSKQPFPAECLIGGYMVKMAPSPVFLAKTYMSHYVSLVMTRNPHMTICLFPSCSNSVFLSFIRKPSLATIFLIIPTFGKQCLSSAEKVMSSAYLV